MVSDKDPDKILSQLPHEAIYYFTNADIPRALDANKLKILANKYDLTGDAYAKVSEALTAAKAAAAKEDLIFIGGSTFVVAEALP